MKRKLEQKSNDTKFDEILSNAIESGVKNSTIVSMITEYNRSKRMLNCPRSLLSCIDTEKPRINTFKALIENLVDINGTEDNVTCLTHAVMHANIQFIEYILSSDDFVLYGEDQMETSIFCCKHGCVDAVKLLIRRNAFFTNASRSNRYGPTAFMHAVIENHLVIASLIFERYPMILERTDASGSTIFHLVCGRNYSCSENMFKLILEFLQVSRTGYRLLSISDGNGNTAFHLACAFGKLDKVKALSTCDVSFYTSNDQGKMPLFEAVSNGSIELVDYLVSSLKIDVNYKYKLSDLDDEEQTAVQYAVEVDNAEMVAYLISKGCIVQFERDYCYNIFLGIASWNAVNVFNYIVNIYPRDYIIKALNHAYSPSHRVGKILPFKSAISNTSIDVIKRIVEFIPDILNLTVYDEESDKKMTWLHYASRAQCHIEKTDDYDDMIDFFVHKGVNECYPGCGTSCTFCTSNLCRDCRKLCGTIKNGIHSMERSCIGNNCTFRVCTRCLIDNEYFEEVKHNSSESLGFVEQSTEWSEKKVCYCLQCNRLNELKARFHCLLFTNRNWNSDCIMIFDQ